jgi:ferredoxin-NADP reductase
VRPFSLCGDVQDRQGYKIAVMLNRTGRGASRHVHEHDMHGAEVLVDGPYNSFSLQPAPAYLFVAGGIGVTPLLPMAREAARAGVPWRMLYVGDDAATMPFVDELTSLPGGECVIAPLDARPAPDLTAEISALADGGQIYCCGPRELCAQVRAAAATLPEGTVHEESCTFSSTATTGRTLVDTSAHNGAAVRAGVESPA